MTQQEFIDRIAPRAQEMEKGYMAAETCTLRASHLGV